MYLGLQLGSLSMWALSSRSLDGACKQESRQGQQQERANPKYSAFQAFICFTFANVLLANGNHVDT